MKLHNESTTEQPTTYIQVEYPMYNCYLDQSKNLLLRESNLRSNTSVGKRTNKIDLKKRLQTSVIYLNDLIAVSRVRMSELYTRFQKFNHSSCCLQNKLPQYSELWEVYGLADILVDFEFFS